MFYIICNFVSKEPPWKLIVTLESGPLAYIDSPNITYSKLIAHISNSLPQFVTTDARKSQIFWSDVGNGFDTQPTSYKSIVNETNQNETPEVLMDSGLYEPRRISFDWITGNIYFMDSFTKRILACSQQVLVRCTVIHKQLEGKPYAIALSTNTG